MGAGFTTRRQIKDNLEQFFDILFLQNAHFFNVASGEQSYNFDNISQLIPVVDDPNFLDGQIYQSAFKDWVFESGVSVPSGFAPATIASGVYVNGTFYDRTDGTYGHAIDFSNGRVIFDDENAVLSTDTVEAEFAYKTFSIQAGDRNDLVWFNLSLESKLKDNPHASGLLAYPNEDEIIMPALFFGIQDSRNTGFAFGGGRTTTYDLIFYVFTRDADEADLIIDTITDLDDKPAILVDFNVVPFPLDFTGDVASDYVPYQVLQTSNILYKGHFRKMKGTSPVPATLPYVYIFQGSLEIERPEL